VTGVFATLRRLHGDLRWAGAQWCLVGGLAIASRSEPRNTRDIEVAVTGDHQAESIIRKLCENRGYRILTVLEETGTARMATARLLPPGTDARGAIVDLLFASSGIEPELVTASTVISVIPDVDLPVATAGHLLALKVLAARPQDLVDAQNLLLEMDDGERQRAREAARLIQERGFARQKDLVATLEEFIHPWEASP
jgi:hypothetical protein